MNNQHKYIVTGGLSAIGILIFLSAFSAFSDNSNFWMLVITTIASSMALLVTNIFITTKAISEKAVLIPVQNNRRK